MGSAQDRGRPGHTGSQHPAPWLADVLPLMWGGLQGQEGGGQFVQSTTPTAAGQDWNSLRSSSASSPMAGREDKPAQGAAAPDSRSCLSGEAAIHQHLSSLWVARCETYHRI